MDIDAALPRFGLSHFRPGQREVISNVIQGNDCLCVMPTGGGKSLCYQLPAVVRDGLTIVVSPLIALMKDQVDALAARGISATLVNSTLTATEQSQRLHEIMQGVYRLVYIAPERLRNSRFLEAIRATPISLLAIDEAHCISEWGHDFRPDYARLGHFREALGMVQTIALTATATEKVRQDIANILRLKNPKQFITGFARKNLHFGCVLCNGDRDKNAELIRYLTNQKGAGIIYAATRKRCESVVELVRAELPDLQIDVYHAGLPTDQRRIIQDRFMSGKLQAIVATNAFGMGIDKSDLRFVIHYNLPGTIEAYYQEAGRAGRDGLPSVCVLLYNSQDRYVQEFFIENANPPAKLVQQVYEFLLAQDIDPIEFTADEIRDRINSQMSSEAINTALQILSKTGVLERLEVGGGLAVVRIDSTLPTLVDLLPKEAKVRRRVLRAVEDAVGDRREESVYVSPSYLMQRSGVEKDALNRALAELRKLEAFDYVPPFRGRAIHFRRTDLKFEELEIDFETLEARKTADYQKLDRVIAFARSQQCRQQTIIEYFGEKNSETCGGCDQCQKVVGWPTLSIVDAATITSSEFPETAKEAILRPEQTKLIYDVLTAIQRLHGRLGKLLIAEFLSGSETVKVQRLKLQRLDGFGLMKSYRKKDVVTAMDCMLELRLLEQKELFKDRPTVLLSPQCEKMLADGSKFPDGLSQAFGFNSVAKTEIAVKQKQPTKIESVLEEATQADQRDKKRAATIQLEPGFDETRNDSASTPERLDVASSTVSKDSSNRGYVDQNDWVWTAKLADKGFSLTEIAAIRRIDVDQVIDDLVNATNAGKTVSCDQLLDRRTQLAIQNTVSESVKSPNSLLRIDSDQARLLRIKALMNSQAKKQN